MPFVLPAVRTFKPRQIYAGLRSRQQKRMAVISAGFVAQKAIERTLASGGDHHAAYAAAKAQVKGYATGAALLLGVRDGD